MKTLLRKQFLDQTWDSSDLENAARWWLLLHEVIAKQLGRSFRLEQTVACELTGFPKSEGEALRTEIERRGRRADLEGFEVSLSDPDTLLVSMGTMNLEETECIEWLLLLFAGQPFDGLALEIRFSLCHPEQVAVSKHRPRPSMLIIAAQLRDEKLLVKSVLRDFPDNGTQWFVLERTPSPDNDLVQAALQEFRETGKVTAGAGRDLLDSKTAVRPALWLMRLILVPPNQPRFNRLALRWLFFAAVFTGIGIMLGHSFDSEGRSYPLLLIPVAVFVLILLFGFLRIELKRLLMYRTLRHLFESMYSDRARIAVLSPHEARALSNDPRVRRYTAELIAAGHSHIGDVAKSPTAEAYGCARVFAARDFITYVTLMCIRSQPAEDPEKRGTFWPVPTHLRAITFFSGGGRVDSSTSWWFGCWRPFVGPDNLIRVVPRERDPNEFLQSHRAAAEAFALERGLTLARHTRLDEYIRLQESIMELDRDHYLAHPYSWGDHLRWYLQWPRKEYRG